MSQTTPKNNANPDVGRTKRTPVTLAIAAMGIVVVGALAWILTDDNNELAESSGNRFYLGRPLY